MNELQQAEVLSLSYNTAKLSAKAALKYLADLFPNKITFSTSFSYEDQVITHLVANMPINIFTLDTGRLFKQTYTTWNNTLTDLKVKINAFYPDAHELQEFVSNEGPDSFYQSLDLRKRCCAIRKVQPLKTALEGYKIWVTGLRAEHSTGRQNLKHLEWDGDNQIIKFHPLLNWHTEEVEAYINTNKIPFNILHEQGFTSIGCEPCTRAIRPGEDFRSGRWWWEDSSKKECGLHNHKTK